MLSVAQQRGRLRSLILKRLKSYNIKAVLKEALRANNQDASGFLQRSISSSRYENSLRVSSSIDDSTGIITDVSVSINMPWGRYGNELDTVAGEGAITNPPDSEEIMQWIKTKNIPTSLTVNSTLKDGSSKKYTYTNTRSSQSAMAYFVAKNISSEEEVRTRYDYISDVAFGFQDVVETAIAEWFDEIGLEFLGDVEVEIANLI
tara:strand:+ start:520 stop:1131 length:612 start_codon:yes stop_codon:yes gene_type:complete